MSWEDVGLKLALILLPVIGSLVAALIGVGIAYLKRQADRVGNETARATLQAALAEADRVAREAITATAQTYVNDLKASREDGKLSSEEARHAMEKAQSYFVARIPQDSLAVLEASLGPMQEWLEEYLEAQIGAEKKYGGGAVG